MGKPIKNINTKHVRILKICLPAPVALSIANMTNSSRCQGRYRSSETPSVDTSLDLQPGGVFSRKNYNGFGRGSAGPLPHSHSISSQAYTCDKSSSWLYERLASLFVFSPAAGNLKDLEIGIFSPAASTQAEQDLKKIL